MAASARGRRMVRGAAAGVCLLLGCASLLSCRKAEVKTPVIAFSRVPPGTEGGPDTIAEISGHVEGAEPGNHIVIYAKADLWWVQPTHSRPFTNVDADGQWSAPTHLGRQYAALLVDSKFHPPAVLRTLPESGAGLRAIQVVKGQNTTSAQGGGRPVPPIAFSGYKWEVRTINGDRGGIMREYDAHNVAVDEKGYLHLRVLKRNDRWVCSEVALSRSLGYGTYLFEVEDVSGLEPAADLEMLTWSQLAVSQDHSEMDINVSRRGDPASKNAEFVVQPYYIAPNVYRYNAPAGVLTYSFDWEPESVSFLVSKGPVGAGPRKAVASHVFTTGVPKPTEETAHINFCAYGFSKVPMQHDAEVVIEKFQYLP